MTTALAYAPPRDLRSKLSRRLTQWRPAQPATLRFAEPLLSICFDDFPASAADEGASIVEAHGARASFYAASGLAETMGPCGRNFSAADIRRLIAAGHEIGCHTRTHADCARRETAAALSDIAANRAALAAMDCPAPRTLAYPYGETTPALKRALAARFLAARGVLAGLNCGGADLMQLRAYPLFGPGALERAAAALRRAARTKAWMIAFTHDVAQAPSPWGTRGRDLDALLRLARELGVAVAPVDAALSRRLPC